MKSRFSETCGEALFFSGSKKGRDLRPGITCAGKGQYGSSDRCLRTVARRRSQCPRVFAAINIDGL